MQVEVLRAGNAVRMLLPNISSIRLKALEFDFHKFVGFPSIVSLRSISDSRRGMLSYA